MSDITSMEVPSIAGRRPDSSRFGSLWAWLHSELSWYSGRPLLVFRIVLASTTVMFLVIVFRIPGAFLGVFFPVIISRDSLRSTRRSAFWVAVACTLAAAELVLGAMLFAGSPALHLFWVCVSLAGIFYFISIFKVYEAALTGGLVVATGITIWDLHVSADVRLRQTLFMLLTVLVGCAVTVVIEYLFARTHPPDAVIGGIQQRLNLTARVLLEFVGPSSNRTKLVHDARGYARRGTGTLREIISKAGYSPEEQRSLSTAVSLAGRLIDLAVTLLETGSRLPESDQELCTGTAKNLSLIQEALLHREIPQWVDTGGGYETGIPILSEIERTVALLAASISEQVWEAKEGARANRAPEPKRKVIAPDALRNKEHAKLAIRGGLSAIVCYLVYMSVGWTGLSASVSTCVLTALPNTGASRHKQLLRFAGVIFGSGVLGYAAQTIILPQIDSILSYTLLFASIVFLGAWVGTSGPLIAYCGAQIVLAYELVNVNRFSINRTLVPSRDAVLGTALGIAAMWLIFDHLWASTTTESIRPLLGATLRGIAGLEVTTGEVAAEGGDVVLDRRASEIMGNIDRLRTLVDVSVFEAFPKPVPDEALLERTEYFLPQLRAALLIKTGLIHHRTISGSYCQSDIAEQVQRRCSELLAEVAERFEGGSSELLLAETDGDRQILDRLRTDAGLVRSGELECDLTELRLCSSLFSVVRHLTVAG